MMRTNFMELIESYRPMFIADGHDLAGLDRAIEVSKKCIATAGTSSIITKHTDHLVFLGGTRKEEPGIYSMAVPYRRPTRCALAASYRSCSAGELLKQPASRGSTCESYRFSYSSELL